MKTKLAILCKALCSPENQPHQWINDPVELEKKIIELIELKEE